MSNTAIDNPSSFGTFWRYRSYLEVANQWLVLLLAVTIPTTTSGTSIVVALLTLIFLISGQWRQKYQLLRQYPVVVIALLLLGCLLLGISYSSAPWHDIVGRLGKYRRLLFIPILIPIFNQGHMRQKALNVFIGVMMIILFLTYLKFYGYLSLNLTPKPSPTTIFYYHTFNSVTYSFLFFIFGCYAFQYPKHRMVLCIAMITIAWYLLEVCTGRTGLLTFFGLIVLLMWRLYQQNRKACCIALLGLIATLVLLVSIPNNLTREIAGTRYAANTYIQKHGKQFDPYLKKGTRLEFYSTSWLMLRDHPGFMHWLVGLGTGSFKSAYAACYHKYQQALHLNCITDNPHDQFIELFVEIGLAGVILLLLLYRAIGVYSVNALTLSRYLGQGLMLVLIIDSLFNVPLMEHADSIFYAYFIAMFAGVKSTNNSA